MATGGQVGFRVVEKVESSTPLRRFEKTGKCPKRLGKCPKKVGKCPKKIGK